MDGEKKRLLLDGEIAEERDLDGFDTEASLRLMARRRLLLEIAFESRRQV